MGTTDIDDFSARLAATRDFDAALDVLAEEVQSLGYDAVDYAALPAARVLDGAWAGQRIFERNFPSGWQHGWREEGNSGQICLLLFTASARPWTNRSSLPTAEAGADQARLTAATH